MINRLSKLYQLQLIDDQLDELEELRGDLPVAVNELKSQIESMKDQIKAKEEEKETSIERRNGNEEEIERLNASLKKFKAQLYQVRNNKEYDALTKEIDHTEEQIDKYEAENVALEELVERIKVEMDEVSPQSESLNGDLKVKEEELKKIIKANEREEAKLQTQRESIAASVRKSDYNTYMRIRKAKGGKAVATIVRAACTACHSVVPPQRQLEIRANKRLYSCESCGRLLISSEVADNAEAETVS